MKVACYTGTKNLYPLMVPAVKSLIKNTTVDKVYLLIEDDDFPYPLPNFVETINISDQTWFKPGGPNMDSPFTYMAMIRAALCHIFPEINTILSLDVDTIFLKPCSEIWDLPIDNCYFAASQEPLRCRGGLLYCNTGIALYNLKKLRDGKADEIIEVLNRHTFDNLEQDVFSYLCQGFIYDMPSDYNVTNFTVDRKSVV